ncbi:esterase LipI-like [Liolophura sinensis]|uniref:esterase LipI-like n=1 Tax=Liolophura sinensis TaxID=3198878 RepID=UPI0031587D41
MTLYRSCVPLTSKSITHKYHPETDAFIKFTDEQSVDDGSEECPVELARKRLNDGLVTCNGEVEFKGALKDVVLSGSDECNGIPATVYVPTCIPNDAAILVYFHGGGMVIGSRASVDTTCRRLAMETPCIIVNVDYRLAPEFKFPASFEDAQSAVNWVVKNKATIGGTEKSPVGVGGDSSGGTLAATVAHQVPGLAFQVLVYPRVSYKPGPVRRSAKDYEDGPILSKDVVAWYRGHFLRGDADLEDPLLNPYFRESFANLPPGLLVVAECDPLRDDSYDYQAKMAEAGVKAEVLQIDGASHSFFTKPGIFVECCAKAYKRVTQFIREVAYA